MNVSSDGRTIFIGGTLDNIGVYDAETLEKKGQIDLPDGHSMSLASVRLFLPDGTWVAARPDRLGHGTAVAEVIRRALPDARIVHAQVFQDRPVTTAIQVASALDWLAGRCWR
ncbi:hypothetical protein [Rhodovulum sp.]|uniref:hypothetical protein n=1 Tax=Rhodovulum sp. TaxID=34009 RepID=UPI00257B318A|nr:hypothetical protein [Rhodovulum sp.]